MEGAGQRGQGMKMMYQVPKPESRRTEWGIAKEGCSVSDNNLLPEVKRLGKGLLELPRPTGPLFQKLAVEKMKPKSVYRQQKTGE